MNSKYISEEFWPKGERIPPDVLARLTKMTEALRHYADEATWTLEPDPDPTNLGKPYYPIFTYDGGQEEPWKVAAEALRGSVGDSDSETETRR